MGDVERCFDRFLREANYEESSLREVPPDGRERWFARQGSFRKLRRDGIAPVEFRLHDLSISALPCRERFDLVLCRSFVFTYFRGERRFRTAGLLESALHHRGVLMVGRKEGLDLRGHALFRHGRAYRGSLSRTVRIGTYLTG